MTFRLFSPHIEWVVLALCFCLLFSTRAKAKVPAIYVFVDSLADVGNDYYLELSFLKADFPHNGVDYPRRKATGRFSNAEKLGVPSPPAYLSIPASSNTTQVFLEGVNFASGGAGVLDSTHAGQCLTLSKQIDYYSTMCTVLVEQLGSFRAQYHLSKLIFAFIVGSNDIIMSSRASLISSRSLLNRLLVP